MEGGGFARSRSYVAMFSCRVCRRLCLLCVQGAVFVVVSVGFSGSFEFRNWTGFSLRRFVIFLISYSS